MTTTQQDVRPTNLEEIASCVAEANALSSCLIVRGGGTALRIGNQDSANARSLDLSNITGVTSYQPADLTVSVTSGTTVAELQAVLAENGQELPIDVPLQDQATIGGLVACGFAGPRRLGSGTLKDLILGCTYVRGDGLVAKAGGSVVKNVSGFEIPRLLHGSWGSLAILASINFKVTPKPKAEMTLSWPVESLESATRLAQSIRGNTPSATSIEISQVNGNVTLFVRLMGRPGALEAQSRELARGSDHVSTVADEESRATWQQRIDQVAIADDFVQIALATRPRYIAEAVQLTLDRLGLDRPDTVVTMSPGIGSARIRFPDNAIVASGLWDRLELATIPGTASALVEFAPDEWKSDIDVWGVRPSGLDVMSAIKTEFDPGNVLNRGRLFI